MVRKKASASCCETACGTGFKVEAILSVDERGQMVLPKDVRDRAGVGPGEKLALIVWEQKGKVCCMSLVKADALQDMVKGLLGPMVQGVVGNEQ